MERVCKPALMLLHTSSTTAIRMALSHYSVTSSEILKKDILRFCHRKETGGRTCVCGRAASAATVMGTLIPRDLRCGGARSHAPQRRGVAFLNNDVRRARLVGVNNARRNCTTASDNIISILTARLRKSTDRARKLTVNRNKTINKICHEKLHCLKKAKHFIFDRNLYKCRRIFKILQLLGRLLNCFSVKMTPVCNEKKENLESLNLRLHRPPWHKEFNK